MPVGTYNAASHVIPVILNQDDGVPPGFDAVITKRGTTVITARSNTVIAHVA
jgi:hypothetical protein